ncbi:AraC family transcriptional regulator [Chryseobacterium sp. Ch-15]|uniref:AraC family transcriptional regulator n=1 Tax=Chryseobacterium muglaense TaxID=2893752 RepID=A0A9Q3UUN2_9FLAO|nr:AraC family transcriptional regulator [Chryseobacterium muglaense]MBD3904093.1 helix-turn-helix transcriptional regulator [Chryseobacterium muglaense]MCC9033335.1 AraC family transcriptional regulator [Chryseobacterium muglaense]MCM2553830.1 AraC family transcriptional regulator [Chryseobacterium muglaense]
MNRFYFILLLFIFNIFYSQQESYSDFYKIKKKYENYSENDTTAFRFLKGYISLAKKEKDYPHLVEGYNDAIFYSSSADAKLKYADSTIFAAKLSSNTDLISDAYLRKGVVYYFNYKKYQPALQEYLKAYGYSKNSQDDFLKNAILYHMGVVKSYLGYNQEALVHFKKTQSYFELKSTEKVHPNIVFNNKRGYYNSLHQMAVSYRKLSNYKAIDSLLNIGFQQTKNNKDFQQEYGYFLKEKGINEYHKKNYRTSLTLLHESIKPITKINDFAWATVVYFYIGKSYLDLQDYPNAILHFNKVDSIFQKHNFILPELRENYELLINYYKKDNELKKELYYTKQLLKADSVISKDFSYLASTIHKKYDTEALTEEKERLEKATSWGIWIIGGLIILLIALTFALIVKYRNEKRIKANYIILEEKILNKSSTEIVTEKIKVKPNGEEKSGLSNIIINDLLLKLDNFEKKCEFVENGLTLNKLAIKFNTNSNYLSQVINEYKEVNFNRYLSELRINYITNKLYNDKVFLSYKIETLAEKCGIASRTNFSNLFQEINGIRPIDFIKKRNEDLENNQVLQSHSA